MICHVCHRNDTHRYSCGDCTATTRRRLRELELYAEWLATPTMLAPTRGTTGRRSPGYGSRPPARDDALVMLDPRSTGEDIGGMDDEDAPLWSLLGTLHGLAHFVRAHCSDSGPRRVTVSGEVGYLLGRLDWCATQRWAAEVAEDVRQLHAQARSLVGDQPPEPVGTCLEAGCDGDVYPARLRDPDGARHDGARCKRCGCPYTGLDLVRLHRKGAR